MGLMRFIVSPPDRITEETLRKVYLSGLDRVPWQVRARLVRGELWMERASSDSASLHIPWPVREHGTLTLATATLRECSNPYYLPLELARGKLAQVRNQLWEWEAAGLYVPGSVADKLSEGTRILGLAVVTQQGSPRSVELAERALVMAIDAAGILTAAYAEQALAARRRTSGKLTTFLGAALGSLPVGDYAAGPFVKAFNAANVPLAWSEVEKGEEQYDWDVCDKQIDWCRANGLAVVAGPLLQLDPYSVPDWLHVCEGDFDGILAFATEFIEGAVRRYRGKVDFWQCAGRVNTADFLSLSEEENVRLSARIIELIHELDPDTRTFLVLDQPWAEYMTHEEKDFSPIHFADALLRAGLGLAGIALEINLGCFPGGTLARDPLEFSQHLDYWGLLGVPLFVRLAVPSDTASDPLAQSHTATDSGEWTPEAQQNWISRYVPPILAKPYVLGVFWNQLSDAEPHAIAHAGLFDAHRQPKPALRVFGDLRQTYLR